MKVVSLLSGGLDSSVLLGYLLAGKHEIIPLSVRYGQRHGRELLSARRVAASLDLPEPILLTIPTLHGSALTDPGVEVPHGHYEDESMRRTVVPNRNMILLSHAAALAIRLDADAIAYAAHAGDHAIYPDCRPDFVDSMRRLLTLVHYRPIRLIAPFIHDRKEAIVAMGARVGVPLEQTWSCYEGGEEHCGLCGTCQERKEAFRLAGVPDPTIYLA